MKDCDILAINFSIMFTLMIVIFVAVFVLVFVTIIKNLVSGSKNNKFNEFEQKQDIRPKRKTVWICQNCGATNSNVERCEYCNSPYSE